MLQYFYPETEADSAYTIDYEQVAGRGIRGIIFDVDNTLVMHGAPANAQAIELFSRLRSLGLNTCILSNNDKPRVRPFAEAVGSPFVHDAHKPSRKGYRLAMERMGTTKEQTLFVGDQLFTDIYGANRTGIHSCLVKPIHPKEEIQIVFKRVLERVVLFFYHREKRRGER